MLLHVVNHASYHCGSVVHMYFEIPAMPSITNLSVILRKFPCNSLEPGSVCTFLNVSTNGRGLIQCYTAHSGVVKDIHGTSRGTTPGGALWPRLV